MDDIKNYSWRKLWMQSQHSCIYISNFEAYFLLNC